MRFCPVTGSNKWQAFYSSTSGRIMTGDQRIVEGNLRKVICPDSGVVANEIAFTPEELELLYGNVYELNTLGREEHFFYTSQGVVARSQIFFEWIAPHLPDSFDTLLEIGCGEGNLLKRFAAKFPGKKFLGLDGSHKAAKLAKSKGLNVTQRVINGEEAVPEADVFLLINVIEHIENIPLLISSVKNSLSDNGRIIFCLPIQDYGGYDIFFAEHVWHFTVAHFESILRRNGLRILHSDANHPVNHGIGLFVCEKINDRPVIIEPVYSDSIIKNIKFWEANFKSLDDYISSNSFRKIAIFGAAEVATLLLTFTSLGDCNLIACIDDTKMPGERKHGIPVYGSAWLNENKVDCLVLAVNKKYHESIREKLNKDKLNIYSIF
jgi:SAM-dependent methyltransferase